MPSTQIAGWLKHFHHDFVMQATRSDPDLDNQIKWAMELESTPMPALIRSAAEQSSEALRWIDVTQTLVIDLSKFQIRRLQLRRRVKIVPIARVARDVRMSGYGNPYEDSLAPMGTEFMGGGENVADSQQEEVDWTEKAPDPDLTAAVESVLRGTPSGSGLQSAERSSVGSLDRSEVLSRATSSLGSYRDEPTASTAAAAAAAAAAVLGGAGLIRSGGTPPSQPTVDYRRNVLANARRAGENVKSAIYGALDRIIEGAYQMDEGADPPDVQEGVLKHAIWSRLHAARGGQGLD